MSIHQLKSGLTCEVIIVVVVVVVVDVKEIGDLLLEDQQPSKFDSSVHFLEQDRSLFPGNPSPTLSFWHGIPFNLHMEYELNLR